MKGLVHLDANGNRIIQGDNFWSMHGEKFLEEDVKKAVKRMRVGVHPDKMKEAKDKEDADLATKKILD